MNVVITGAAGGLGIEIAKQTLERNDNVWAFDIKKNLKIEELEDSEYSDNLHFFECDISSTEDVANKLKVLKNCITEIDEIYNCAGFIRPQDRVPLEETDLDAIAKVVDINAVGFLRIIKELLPLINAQTKIICVTSEAGSIGANHRSQEYSYAMSKCAENMACVILQKYFDEKIPGARVVCRHPGWLKTTMGGGNIAEVNPSDSAKDLMKIASDIDTISRKEMFIDHRRNKMPW